MGNRKAENIALAPLAEADLPACAAIAAAAPDPWSGAVLQRTLADARALCLAAKLHGQTAGFACFENDEDAALLEMLVVAPAARRQGVALALMREGEARLAQKGVRRLLLEVRCGNTAAVGLYQKLGFATLARRPGLYTHPKEDGLTMEKRL